MTGTTGSHYDVIFQNANGAVGFRALSGEKFRVRLVSSGAGEVCTPHGSANWKKPGEDGQNRFSAEAYSVIELTQHVAAAVKALVCA